MPGKKKFRLIEQSSEAFFNVITPRAISRIFLNQISNREYVAVLWESRRRGGCARCDSALDELESVAAALRSQQGVTLVRANDKRMARYMYTIVMSF